MIHLVIREPIAYQRTLCQTLSDSHDGAFVAWFTEGQPQDFLCRKESETFRYRFLAAGYGSLYRELRADSQAIVILGSWSSAIAYKTLLITTLLRIPVFIWTDHPHPRNRTWIFDRLRKAYLRLLSYRVSGFLACGRPTVAHLEGLGLAPDKITNFPYWVDVPEQWSVPRRCATHTQIEPLHLLAVGRQVPVKQFEVAIQAIAQVNRDGSHQVELVLAGDGPERPELEALATTLGSRQAVRFVGWLNNADVFKELERADALVLTSRFDAYGVVVLEAMAMGRAVLASDGVVAARDRNDGGAVFLHPAGDAEVLAGQIRLLAQDRELLRQASFAARTIAEEWPPERSAAILAKLLAGKEFKAKHLDRGSVTNPQSQNVNVR